MAGEARRRPRIGERRSRRSMRDTAGENGSSNVALRTPYQAPSAAESRLAVYRPTGAFFCLGDQSRYCA